MALNYRRVVHWKDTLAVGGPLTLFQNVSWNLNDFFQTFCSDLLSYFSACLTQWTRAQKEVLFLKNQQNPDSGTTPSGTSTGRGEHQFTCKSSSQAFSKHLLNQSLLFILIVISGWVAMKNNGITFEGVVTVCCLDTLQSAKWLTLLPPYGHSLWTYHWHV